MKVILIILFLFINVLYSKPFTPTQNNDVVLTIKLSPLDKKISTLLNKLQTDSQNLKLVDEIIELYIKSAKQTFNLNYIGYAQSLLEKYKYKYPNSYMLNMHYADIYQYTHKFDKALTILKQIISINPKDTNAHLMKASIYQAQKKYSIALKSCNKLVMLSSSLISITCISTMKSHLGKLTQSYDLLKHIYRLSKQNSKKKELQWTLTSLADMSYRLKDKKQALKYLEKSIELDKYDFYALKVSADILFEFKEYQKIVQKLSDYKHIRALFLRLTVANLYLNKPVEEDKASLLANLEILKLKKEHLHKEDEKYYKLLGEKK
jgi:tetratricopeptide (TPR) repeat protein